MEKLRLLFAGLLFITAAAGQDHSNWFQDLKLQIHGNAAQGFLLSSNNNYLTTKSSDGSGKWTEGSLSIRRSITDKLNAGAQVHSYSLGMLGRQNVMLDWAYGDFKLNTHLGVRAGKVKSPMGLYNEVQDIDAVHQWALLPQGVYPAEVRGFSLSHSGGILYGEFSPSQRVGTLAYHAFGGYRSQPLNEGLTLITESMGLRLGRMGGATGGLDLRWKLPFDGLVMGATYSRSQPSAPDSYAGPFPMSVAMDYTTYQMYSQFDRGDLSLSAELKVNPYHAEIGPAPLYVPSRGWYVMGTYRVANRLSTGMYYTEMWKFMSDRDRTSPLNYFKDVVVNTRIELNRFLYCKLEGHFMSGNTAGFYSQVNPYGFEKNTALLLARIGFAF